MVDVANGLRLVAVMRGRCLRRCERRGHRRPLWPIVHRRDGDHFVDHCGTFDGFNACLLDYRAEDLVVAMIFNTYAGGFPPAEKLAALFRMR